MSTNERTGGGMPGDAERDPRLDRYYREARHEEPPAHLDAAILAAAHREVGARPRSARLRAWRVPVSIAAVVVLSVSLVTLVREEGGGIESLTANSVSGGMRTAPVSQTAPEAERYRTQSAEPATDASAMRERAKREQPAVRDHAAPARQDAAKTPEDTAGHAAATQDSARRSEEQARQAADAITGQTVPEARAPTPASPAPQPFQSAPALREQRPAPADPAAGAAAGLLAGSESGGPSSELKASPESGYMPQERGREAPPPAERRDAAPAPAMKPVLPSAKRLARPPAKAAPSASGPTTALIRELEVQPAEKWLEKIEALRRDGRGAESDELLAEFKRRFPDYPLPATLR